MKIRAWLRLVRAPALPTTLADVWLGAAVVDLLTTWNLLYLSLISLALYAAGLILNDVHDVAADRKDNPGRPLPSGAISVPVAAGVGGLLLAAAVAGAALLGAWPARVAVVLAALVLGYDFLLKDTPLGPLNMGLCRAANVVLGMSALPAGRLEQFVPAWKAAAPVFVFVVGVTLLARWERRGRRPRGALVGTSLCIALAGAAVLVVAHIEAATALPDVVHGTALLGMLGGVLALLVAVAVSAALWALWKAKDLRKAVTVALVCIIPLEALVALAHWRVDGLAAILLLLVPVFLMRKLSHIT